MDQLKRRPSNNVRVKRKTSGIANNSSLTTRGQKLLDEISQESRSQSEDEDYDTDFESDDSVKATFDNTGVDTYLKTCKKLRQLPVRHVCESLVNNKAVEVRNRGLNALSVLSIINALLVNVNITTLCLDGNALTSKALKYISWMLTENISITTLSLNENNFTSDGIEELCNTIRKSTTLVKLSLSGNGLQDENIVHVANMLIHNSMLQDLNISYNSITDEGAVYIAEALAVNDYLRILDISWNKIRPAGTAQIAKAVQENVMLKNLNISMNGISDQGCLSLSHMLQKNYSLTHLNISNSRITDKDAIVLVSALQKNESLRSLNISHNTLNTPTVVGLLQAVKLNESKSLLMLDMSGIHIFRTVLFFVQQIKQSRSLFRFLHGDIVTCSGNLADEEMQLISNCDPRSHLTWYMTEKNLSVNKLIENNAGSNHLLSLCQLKQFLKKIGLAYSDVQLTQLFTSPAGELQDHFNLQSLSIPAASS